ncbi:hypothetical protein P7C73_g5076, partial [Tremellales sp. Uapishka_1]
MAPTPRDDGYDGTFTSEWVPPSATTAVVHASATATAIFPNNGSSSSTTSSGTSSAAVIGGILGGLAGLTLLFFWYRYYAWRKNGGEGDFFVTLCGEGHKEKAAAKKAAEWPLWPMMKSRPKYDT